MDEWVNVCMKKMKNDWVYKGMNERMHSTPGNESLLMQIKLFGVNTLTLLNLCRHIMPAFLCESKIEWILQPEATGRWICHWSEKTISEEN